MLLIMLTTAAVLLCTSGAALAQEKCQQGWAKCGANPVLEGGGPGEWDDAVGWNRAVLYEDGLFHMWYAGCSSPEVGFGDAVGYATSPDGIEWTKYAGNPVLHQGQAGEWDELILPGTVISDDNGYTMWYTAFLRADSDLAGVGVATSPDGITWTKHPANPVLTGDPGSFEGAGPLFASVVFDGELYRMWYLTREDDYPYPNMPTCVGLATSPDGINWTRHGEPLFTNSAEGWDWFGLWGISVVADDDGYHMFYTGDSYETAGIGYASSPDGINWTKGGGDGGPVLGSGKEDTDWDSWFIAEPSVVFVGTTAHMWYRGVGDSGGIGYATADVDSLFFLHDRLNDHRFALSVMWWDQEGTVGDGTPIKLTDDTGSFWFFDEANLELMVKVLDGCAVNGHYWVFAAGLTDVGVSLNVRDTQTSELKTFTNTAGDAYQPILDTTAFLCD